MKRIALGLAILFELSTTQSAPAFSTNVVVPIVPGFNLLSNPLDKTDNRLSSLLPNATPGTYVYRWNKTNQSYAVFMLDEFGTAWMPNNPTIQTGEGFWVRFEPPVPSSVTFTGTYPTNPPSGAGPGFCLIGPRGAFSSDFQTMTGFAPPMNALVYNFVPNGSSNVAGLNPFDPQWQVFRYEGNAWFPSAPTFSPGHGYFLHTNYVRPTITMPPQSQTNSLGGTVVFSVQATGTIPLFYQWRLNGLILTNRTSNSLVLTNLMSNQAGSYDVFVYNAAGAVTSSVAALSLSGSFPDESFPPPWSRGSNGTTYQIWSLDRAGSESNFTFNPRGQGVVRPDGNATYLPVFQGRSGVWNLQTAGSATNPAIGRLRLAIPNYGVPLATILRLQVSYFGAAPSYSVYVPTGGVPAFHLVGLPLQAGRGNGWTNELTVWQFDSCPTLENLDLTPALGAATALDQIIVDTICPAPPTARVSPIVVLVSLGWRADGAFRFRLLGTPNNDYVIDISSDIRNWIPWQTNLITAPLEIVDPDARRFPRRFYRVRVPPL